jgi:hypothetical protein
MGQERRELGRGGCSLAEKDGSDELADVRGRYEDAQQRRQRILAEWQRLGEPVMAESASSIHPLLRALNDVDLVCSRLRRELAPGKAGRPPGAVSAPDRAAPPKTRKLKSV